MITLAEVKDWLKEFGLADHYYVGKLSTKYDKSIGVYQRDINSEPRMAIGGLQNTSYDIKHISVLVHWNNDADETEKAAYKLFEKICNVTDVIIGDTHIYMIQLRVSEPKDVGTDDKGIYERVIWFDLYYEKGRKR